MLTIILLQDNSDRTFQETFASMERASKKTALQYYYVDITEGGCREEVPPLLSSACIRAIHVPGGNLYQILNELLPELEGDYVHFMRSGQLLAKEAIRYVNRKCRAGGEHIPFFYKKNQRRWNRLRREEINLSETPHAQPLNFYGGFYPTNLLQEFSFPVDLRYDSEYVLLYQMLNNSQRFDFISGKTDACFVATPFYIKGFTHASDPEWYTQTLEKAYLPMIEGLQPGELSYLLQYAIFSQIRIRFIHNLNTGNKHVFKDDEQLQEFYGVCSRLLQYIDDVVLLEQPLSPQYRLTNPLRYQLLELKYGAAFHPCYCYDEEEQDMLIGFHEIYFSGIKAQTIRLDVMNYEQGVLSVYASFMNLMHCDPFRLLAELNGKPVAITETTCFADTSYFGKTVHRRYTFRLDIRQEDLDKKNLLCFYCEFQDKKIPLTINPGRFPSRLNRLKGAYWKFGRNMIFFTRNQGGLRIRRKSVAVMTVREIRLWLSLFCRSKRMLILRILYQITRPWFRNKNIWITYDKMYKGGDNGEYFYKYAMTQENDVIPKYIINRDYPDAQRLLEEGYQPLFFGTLKQKLYFLNSSIVATTHANIPVFSGILPTGFNLLRDLFQAKVVCIQHGLSVQQMEHNLNTQYDNLRKFYFASKYEIKNLSQPAYGYENQKEMFCLTGVPRYDGLVNRDQRQILITPTWRAYISMPASIGNVRPYSDAFRETVYYKIYNSLITNEKLMEAALKYRYRILYLLHPTISSQIEDYTPGRAVEVLSPVGADYEQLLTESSLMVTDYSGVQFDFAYMRKPILYYHPTELPPHYEEGGFLYETMGFGEIATTEDALVDALIEYMSRDCRMKKTYRQRADDFFAYDDHNSCKRIYDDLYHYQKTFQKEESI